MKLIHRIRRLFRIVLFQRVLRLILRGAWLGGGTYLLLWGANSLWGIFPQRSYWVLCSAVIGFFTLITIFFRSVSLPEFVWRVDRLFNLKEQVSTAYEVQKSQSEKTSEEDSLEGKLVREATDLLPAVTHKVIDGGWKIRNDIEASVIVLMLLFVVYLSGMESFRAVIPGIGLGVLPSPGSDPSFMDVYGSGFPGDRTGTSPFSEAGESEQVEAARFGRLSNDEIDQVVDALGMTGKALKNEAVTALLGRALENGNFGEALDELGNISENINRLTPETRQHLADGFSVASRELFTTQFSDISDILAGASQALQGEVFAEMSHSLEEVSEIFEYLKQVSRTHVDSEQDVDDQDPVDNERLQGEGDELIIGTAADLSDLLSVPGGAGLVSGQANGGEIDYTSTAVESDPESVFEPYDFQWEDKDVISSYFLPR